MTDQRFDHLKFHNYTMGITDFSFDVTTKHLLVVKDNTMLIRVDSTAVASTFGSNIPANLHGDLDGSVFWSINNSAQTIEGIFIGNP